MQNIHALRRQATARVRDGSLPGRIPARYYGGEGNGKSCAVCLVGISPSEMMIEIPRTESVTTLMHVQCYRVYAQVVDSLASPSSSDDSVGSQA